MDDRDEKAISFNKWLRKNGNKMGYYLLPPQQQGRVHEMLRQSYRAGIRFEQRRNEPIRVGGVD